MRALLLTLLLSLSIPAQAATLAGVTAPDTVKVGGQDLVLNGLGLREKWTFDVYVGALYLPAKTGDADKAVKDDVPKRMDMHFVRSIGAEKMRNANQEALDKLPNKAALQERFMRLDGLMDNVGDGDVITFSYVPGEGTTVLFNNVKKDTIEGADFMQGLFSMYIGPNPPTAALKKGLMGG